MFKNFFKKPAKDIKSIFLAGSEVNFNGDSQCENFLVTQATNKETIEKIFSGIEMVFEDNRLVKTYKYENGIRSIRKLEKEETNFQFRQITENRILQLHKAENGQHQLGGEVPNNLAFPESNCVVPFQYLGYINNDDINFRWLPNTIHLVCPIFLNFEKLFLDYADPNKPIIINKEEIEQCDTSYDDDLNKDSIIVFEKAPFSSFLANNFYDDNDNKTHEEIMRNVVAEIKSTQIGIAGIPNWIQYPDIPVCPKSEKVMKFLCQLTGGVKTKLSNVIAKNEFYNRYYDELNFWGDGDLFVFYEPETNTACYMIQHT